MIIVRIIKAYIIYSYSHKSRRVASKGRTNRNEKRWYGGNHIVSGKEICKKCRVYEFRATQPVHIIEGYHYYSIYLVIFRSYENTSYFYLKHNYINPGHFVELFKPGRMNSDDLWKPNTQLDSYPEQTIVKMQTPRRTFKSLEDVLQGDQSSSPVKHSSYHVPPGIMSI